MDNRLVCLNFGDEVVSSDKKFPSEAAADRWYGPGDPGPDYDVPSLKCDKCGANMVRRLRSEICLSSPPMRELQWWCKCGVTHCIRYEVIPGYCKKEPWEREWEEANPGKESSHA